jgi:hypothetical protein
MRHLAILVVLCCASSAHAALLVYEGFDYPVGQPVTGNVNPSNGQTWFQAGAVTRVNSISVASGNLTPPPQLQATSGESATINGVGNTASNGIADRLSIGGAVSGDMTVYYSLMMRVDALTGSNNANGGFFIGLNNSVGAQAGSPTAAGARLQARIDPVDGTKYNLGIFNNRSAVAASTSWSPAQLSVGDPIFVVGSYDLNPGANNDVSRLWINPGSLGGAEPAPSAIDTVAGTEFTQIASVLLRQSPAPWLTVDELRVGTTWEAVTTPEPSSLSLVLIGSLLTCRRGRLVQRSSRR